MTLEILREAVELKKLNANLMKPGLIEDLVGDTYAMLYATVVPDLVTKSNEEENRVRMRVDHLLTDPTAEKVPPPDSKLVDLTSSGAAPKQPRAKSISRREIQRRAESLVLTKPVAPPPASKPRSLSSPKILAAVEIPERIGMARQTSSGGALLAVTEREDAVKDISSIPGSLHDSADDESELSDVEELMEDVEPAPRVMFPGLVAGRGTVGRQAEGEEEGDDEEEEEEGGGGGGGGGGAAGGDDEEEEEEEKGQVEEGEGDEGPKTVKGEGKGEEEKMGDQDEVGDEAGDQDEVEAEAEAGDEEKGDGKKNDDENANEDDDDDGEEDDDDDDDIPSEKVITDDRADADDDDDAPE